MSKSKESVKGVLIYRLICISWKHFYQKIRDGLFQDLVFFISLEVGDALVLSYPETSDFFVSGADQKKQKNDFDANLITNMHRNNF